MPTVLRVDGYEIVIYFDDHLPAHVHVFSNGGEAIILLSLIEGEAVMREAYRLKSRQAKAALAVVSKHQALLCTMWKEIHGDF